MDSLQEFSRRIEAQLAAAKELPLSTSTDFEQSMARFASRLQEFEALAGRLMADVIRPRMERLAGYFHDTTISKPDDPYHCTCWFPPQGPTPGMAMLQLGSDHDERWKRLELTYDVKIVPAFFPYERHDKLVFDLVPARMAPAWREDASDDRVDQRRIADWVETRLLGFIDTYFRQQRCGSGSSDGPVIDPVCGMRITISAAKGSSEYKGYRYYFCSEKCGALFAATPEHFAKVVVE